MSLRRFTHVGENGLQRVNYDCKEGDVRKG